MKNLVRKTLGRFGLELRRTQDESVPYENFLNLVLAYEQRYMDLGGVIPSNDLRPKLLSRLMGTPPSEAYAIIESLEKTKNLSGDICEFGVAQGATTSIIANEISQSSEKVLHLFDSFEGLPKPTEKDELKDDIFSLGSMEAYEGTMSCPEDMVKTRLKAIQFPDDRCVIHKGFIETSIQGNENLPQQVSFAYIDFDFYEPIKIALEFLHQISPVGAIFVVDDYDFFSTGVKTAVEEFLEERKNESST